MRRNVWRLTLNCLMLFLSRCIMSSDFPQISPRAGLGSSPQRNVRALKEKRRWRETRRTMEEGKTCRAKARSMSHWSGQIGSNHQTIVIIICWFVLHVSCLLKYIPPLCRMSKIQLYQGKSVILIRILLALENIRQYLNAAPGILLNTMLNQVYSNVRLIDASPLNHWQCVCVLNKMYSTYCRLNMKTVCLFEFTTSQSNRIDEVVYN